MEKLLTQERTHRDRRCESTWPSPAQARAILNKPANRVIADQSDFLNQLFARKSLSWTHIFTEMEKIVPAGLHVVSIKPEYTKTNDLVLHVIVATDREAPFVLDEILGNATDLPISEHATDTHGASLLNFALFDLVGLQLSPRIRDLGKITLYRTASRGETSAKGMPTSTMIT